MHEFGITDLAVFGHIVQEAYDISSSKKEGFPQVFRDITDVPITSVDLFKIKNAAKL